jgi:alkanesulfonate monooxygenase SsuD/methylene tetrahydromethanopterin reductase-like flavin-dependent oxidoreductase (luciferase family)
VTFFGLQLHPQYTTWDEMRESALLAESCGWDVLMTWDHFVPLMGDVTGPNLEGWQVLAAFGAITKKPQIGMLVTGNTYRHPAVLANMAATLDNITNGRAILGVGAAWNEHEHKMYGIDFDTAPIRLAKFREAVRIQRGLLDTGKVTYAGKYYQLENATLGTRPIQKRLPILVGGGGELVTLKVTALYADWWHGFGTADVIKHKVEVLKKHCADVGRDYNEIAPTAGGGILVRDDLNTVDKRMREVAARNKVEAPNRPANLGRPEDIAKRLLEYHKVGVKGFLFGMAPPYDRETIERTMSEVKPRFLELAKAG